MKNRLRGALVVVLTAPPAQAVDFFLSGTIWASGVGREDYGFIESEGRIDAFPDQASRVHQVFGSERIPIHATGIPQSGTCTIAWNASGVAEAEFGDDTNTGRHCYGAPGHGSDSDHRTSEMRRSTIFWPALSRAI